VLLGGAALTRDYAEDDLANLYTGPLLYCKDAFEGLHMMDAIAGGEVQAVRQQQRERAAKRKAQRAAAVKPQSADAAHVERPATDNHVPRPPFWGRRAVTNISPQLIFPFINELALFRGQWGFKQGKLSKEDFEKLTEEKAKPIFEQLQQRALAEGFLQPKVVYGYFPVQSEGNDVIVYHPEQFEPLIAEGEHVIRPDGAPKELLRFNYPRQEGRRRLCIADYFRSVESKQYDVLGLQLVTVGDRATELAESLRAANQYQDYLYLHGFGVESAEALAEYWHKHMRQELGFGSEDSPKIRDLFQQGYRGSRYSFGYPACPDLAERQKVVELLKPEALGVTLSENFMLVPEQSTDALVVHHPQAKYFDV
jgi:5-methyltetrahydrofolate--homocysteine methyltransferase